MEGLRFSWEGLTEFPEKALQVNGAATRKRHRNQPLGLTGRGI